MILGIGIDIINSKRLEKLVENQTFLKRVLTENEIKNLHSKPANRKASFLAKRFSGKEAFSKALGSGIGGDFEGFVFNFQSIEIISNEKNVPSVVILDKNLKKFISKSFISFSDESFKEENLISAFVVLEK